jgi:hypothetical protein
VALMMAVIGLCQILTLTGPAGKLKNWKSEKLTTGTQLVRIPEFQVFTHP